MKKKTTMLFHFHSITSVSILILSCKQFIPITVCRLQLKFTCTKFRHSSTKSYTPTRRYRNHSPNLNLTRTYKLNPSHTVRQNNMETNTTLH